MHILLALSIHHITVGKENWQTDQLECVFLTWIEILSNNLQGNVKELEGRIMYWSDHKVKLSTQVGKQILNRISSQMLERLSPSTPHDQLTSSPCHPLYLSYGSYKEDLLYNQELLNLSFIFFMYMTLMFDSGMILMFITLCLKG